VTVPARLSLVTLGARDVPRLRDFYESLGWVSPSPPGDEFARFELGGAVLALYRAELLAKEAGGTAPSPEGTFGGFTCAINVEREQMVDEALEAARAAGARILAEPITREWGGRSAYFADPEGNAWEIAWLPGSSFDERGALIWPT
jgi:catechol 2,3-dioxygenase-like lactoylglutathione lyase family enzyme